jgi:phage baseplate assembly protein gpV
MEAAMRRLTVLLAPLVLAPTFACLAHRAPTRIHQTHTFPSAPDKLVEVDLRSLDLTVRVAPADVISADVDLNVEASSHAAARRWLERNTPTFDDSTSTLEVRQRSHGPGLILFGFIRTRGTLRLTIPPTCRLEVHTGSGDVTIEGDAAVSGPVRIGTASGDVTVRGGVHEMVVRTASGDVRVSGAMLAGFEADTASGDVTLRSGSARTLVESSSGDVRLERLTGGLSVDTSSGDVAASWDALPAGERVRVHTSSGDVRLRLPEGTALSGEASTSSGSIHTDFPGSSQRRERRLTFHAAPPAVELDVNTSSGDVILRKGAPGASI